MEIHDQMGRSITITKPLNRIVSLVPSQTELLVDLELENQLVGVTKFCVHPESLREQKTIVGGTKQVHYDKIEALRPDIILCNKEENTKEMVERLEKIAPVWVSDIKTIDDCLEMIDAFGDMFDKPQRAGEIRAAIKMELDSFKEFIKEKPTVKVIYLIWKNPWMAAGSSTFINTLLKANHFENSVAHRDERYPEITAKELKKADLILLSSEPYPFKRKHIKELQQQLKDKKVLLVDGEYFSWYGSRLIKAFSYFRTLH
ncbi:MAG: helical backbone metal receptor [Flavobacteriaceae bacterium]